MASRLIWSFFSKAPLRTLPGGTLIPVALTLFLCLQQDRSAQSCAAPDGIVAWWPFDEMDGLVSRDIAGTNDGQHVGGPLPSPGMVGGSLAFDGSNYVVVPDSELWNFGTDEFTIEFWANFDVPAQGSTGHPGDVFISNDEGPFNVPKWFFALNSSTLDFLTCCGPGWAFSPNAPFAPEVGRWYHLAATRSGPDYRIYVDGQLGASGANSSIIPDVNAVLTIGRALEPFGGFMNGRLDEMTIYNRVLTEEELLAIVTAGSSGKCKGVTIATHSLSAFQLGAFSTQQLEAQGGLPPYSWTVVTGDLPPGMSLSSDGLLSGTPTVLGSSTFEVMVADASQGAHSRAFTAEVVLITPPPDVRATKAGTLAVPGRILDYFITVTNSGVFRSGALEVLELLIPSGMFEFVSASPLPDTISEESLLWRIPGVDSGESVLLSYRVRLDPTLPFGTGVPGPVHIGGTGSASQATREFIAHVSRVPSCVDPACVTLALQCADLYCNLPLPWPQCVQCLQIAAMCVENCPEACDLFPDSFALDCQAANGPVDPNEKVVVAETFIAPDQTLVYAIHFENVGNVEALDVFVADVLETNLDLATLEILTPGGASFDQGTGTLRWDLLGINLQPGDTGNVLFSVRPLQGLPSGTTVRNSAEIRFEVFEPLVTPEVVNVIDTTPPEGRIGALPLETNTLRFPLSWTGNDLVGEIDSYSVFVSCDKGSYQPFLTGVKETETIFSGIAGSRYDFFCVAVDSVGNVEPQEVVAEASTRIDVSCVHRREFWEARPDLWSLESMTLGSVVYDSSQLLAILDLAVDRSRRKNPLVVLAAEVITARLNEANGLGLPRQVQSLLARSDVLIGADVVPPVGAGSGELLLLELAKALGTFNSGRMPGGPVGCE